MRIQRVGNKILTIGNPGLSIISPRGGAIVPWYLAGGIDPSICIAAYQPIGAASLAASYVNLANPGTYNCTLGTAPAWTGPTGWQFNGSTNSRYLKTGITLDSVNWSMIVRASNLVTGPTLLSGCKTAVPDVRFAILGHLSNITYYEYGAPTTGWLAINTNFSGGVLGISGANGYRNGVREAGAIATLAYPSGVEIYIGCWNDNGTALQFVNANIQAIAFYNNIVTASQFAAATTAMNAL